MAGTVAAGTLGVLAGCFLRTTVVLTLAFVAAAAAKRRPAAFRHFILSSALIGLLLLPLLTLMPVGWRSPLIPAWMAAPALRAVSAPATQRPGRAAEISRQPKLDAGAQIDGRTAQPGLVFRHQAPDGGELQAGETLPALSSNGQDTDRYGRGSASPASASQGHLNIPNTVVEALWSAGLAALCLRLLIGLAGAVRLTAEGTALDDPAWRTLIARFLALVSIRREVRLKSHPEVLVPLTWGWRKPVVLLPDGADTWTDDERSSALYHELSHVKRADFLVMLLVRTSLALFWWNPLCWIVYRELLKEQELACDELVLRAGIRPSTYAASLLAFRRSAGFRWNPSAALLGMLGRSSFQTRLAAILKQKLTLMEVKMKTKIMLALALVLAVALIGTARPAVGIEKSSVTASLAATAAPAAATLEAVQTSPVSPVVQADQATAQEKQKEHEKAKAAEKAKEAEKTAKEKSVNAKTIVIKPVGEEGEPIEVTITEGDTTKTLVLERSMTITKDKDGKVLILTPEGKEPIILKGDPLRLEIKGGGLEVMREGKALNISEEGGKIVFYGTTEPEVAEGKFKIVEKTEAGEAAPEVIVKRIKELKPGEKWVVVEPGQEAQTVKIVKKGEGGTAWTIEEPEKGEAVWVAKEVAGRPVAGTWVGEGGRSFAFSTATGKEMLDRVQALEEQVQAIKAKKMDISALEESLKKLEAELKAKEEELRTFEYKLDNEPDEITMVKKIREGGAKDKVNIWVTQKDTEMDLGKDIKAGEAKAYVKVVSKDEGAMTIVIGEKGLSREAYERALAKLKGELPEGYKIAESDFDEEGSSMTFKISVPEGKKTDESLIKKIVQSLKAEVDKK